MDGCAWRTENGVTFLHVDFRSGDEATTLARLAASEQAVAEAVAAGGPGCRVLVEVEGFSPSRAFLTESKLVNKRTFGPARCRVAVTGVSPVLAMVVRGWSTVGGGVRAQACPDEASALRFLALGG